MMAWARLLELRLRRRPEILDVAVGATYVKISFKGGVTKSLCWTSRRRRTDLFVGYIDTNIGPGNHTARQYDPGSFVDAYGIHRHVKRWVCTAGSLVDRLIAAAQIWNNVIDCLPSAIAYPPDVLTDDIVDARAAVLRSTVLRHRRLMRSRRCCRRLLYHYFDLLKAAGTHRTIASASAAIAASGHHRGTSRALFDALCAKINDGRVNSTVLFDLAMRRYGPRCGDPIILARLLAKFRVLAVRDASNDPALAFGCALANCAYEAINSEALDASLTKGFATATGLRLDATGRQLTYTSTKVLTLSQVEETLDESIGCRRLLFYADQQTVEKYKPKQTIDLTAHRPDCRRPVFLGVW